MGDNMMFRREYVKFAQNPINCAPKHAPSNETRFYFLSTCPREMYSQVYDFSAEIRQGELWKC